MFKKTIHFTEDGWCFLRKYAREHHLSTPSLAVDHLLHAMMLMSKKEQGIDEALEKYTVHLHS
jgi:hypothetical protein